VFVSGKPYLHSVMSITSLLVTSVSYEENEAFWLLLQT